MMLENNYRVQDFVIELCSDIRKENYWFLKVSPIVLVMTRLIKSRTLLPRQISDEDYDLMENFLINYVLDEIKANKILRAKNLEIENKISEAFAKKQDPRELEKEQKTIFKALKKSS